MNLSFDCKVLQIFFIEEKSRTLYAHINVVMMAVVRRAAERRRCGYRVDQIAELVKTGEYL